MADYRLTRSAEADFQDIAAYTISKFGILQARRYRDGLERALAALAKHPLRGRAASDLAPGLRRWRYRSHVILFIPEAGGVLIVRVLHQRMDIPRHATSEN